MKDGKCPNAVIPGWDKPTPPSEDPDYESCKAYQYARLKDQDTNRRSQRQQRRDRERKYKSKKTYTTRTSKNKSANTQEPHASGLA